MEGGAAKQPRIEDVLKAGQVILCQVTKNPIGAKGARLTQEVRCPAASRAGAQLERLRDLQRLGDTERRRLRRIIDEVEPEGHGLIVRTAAEGVSADELRRDVASLLGQWKTIEPRPRGGRAGPALPRARAGGADPPRGAQQRYRGVVIVDRALFQQVATTWAVSPELAERVEYFDRAAEGLPIFERYTCTSSSTRRWTARSGCRRGARSSSSGPRR